MIWEDFRLFLWRQCAWGHVKSNCSHAGKHLQIFRRLCAVTTLRSRQTTQRRRFGYAEWDSDTQFRDCTQPAAEKLSVVRWRHCNCTLPTHIINSSPLMAPIHLPPALDTPWLTSLGCLNSRTRVLQYSLLQTYVRNRLRDWHLGVSISRSPGRGSLNISYPRCAFEHTRAVKS